jgi:beta-fructofuranosidase
MNDPNGPIYWKGKYHMFYQYNPDGAFWGDMHWGHAISPDMVHWKHLPVALAPTPGASDADGCFSGTAVVQDGQVVLLYTGVRSVPEAEGTIKLGAHSLREAQCLAVSNDPILRTWSKLPTPILSAPPAGMDVAGFRDPSPWSQGGWWYMVIGSGIVDQGGAVLLYKSMDLRSWQFVHLLARRESTSAITYEQPHLRETWECPEFFALGGKHVLIYSTIGKAYWQSGELDPETMTFHPEQAGILDYGALYAPKTQLDKSGNRILWGWIRETRKLEDYKASGWAGVMSLPRVLSLAPDGRIRTSVAKEVSQLRKREQTIHVTKDEMENQRQIAGLRVGGRAGEILCTVHRESEPLQLSLYSSAGAADLWLSLRYDPRHLGEILIDNQPFPLTSAAQEDLNLHLYIDGSVIEVFVNSQVVYTKRIYPLSSSAEDLCLQWTGRTSNIVGLSVWQLSPISADRLTT